MFTKKTLIILIGKQSAVAFVAIGLALLAVTFLANEITRISNGVVQNRLLAEKLEKSTERFSEISRDIAMIGTSDTVLNHAFPSADNILEFILILDNTAFKNGASESYHFDTPTVAQEVSSFPLSTIGYQNTLAQNITSFSKYLKDFEALPYFTRIDSLSFSSQDASGWQKGGSASYHAVLYTKTPN